jgi:hypothetical protein
MCRPDTNISPIPAPGSMPTSHPKEPESSDLNSNKKDQLFVIKNKYGEGVFRISPFK